MQGISPDQARRRAGGRVEQWRGAGGQVLYMERLSPGVVKRIRAREAAGEEACLAYIADGPVCG